jgi:hypothetical protein
VSLDPSAPDRAPARPDLGFLRHRSRPAVASGSPLAEFLSGGRSHRSGAAPGSAAPGAPSSPVATPPARTVDLLDLSADPLDLSAPRSPAPPSGPRTDTSLDLSATAPPARATAPPARATAPPARATAPPARAGGPTRTARPADIRSGPPGRQEARTRPDVPTILTARSPTVSLTRVQSGVGTLVFEAITTPSIGDARLGCAYQLRSGRSSTVQHSAGRRTAPRGETRRPIVLAQRQQFERLEVDLRQSPQLERMVVFGFPGNGADIRWAGTLVVTTFGEARIELPITLPPSSAVAVLASMYNVRGELVLRSEMDPAGRTIQEACGAYGFDRITWLDANNPVD